jgi:hypothetical protein
VKAIVAGVAVLGICGAFAEEKIDWQTPQQVLASIEVGKTPKKPRAWQSPRGSVVLHGDFFGDGRHLALVGGAGTSWAVVKDGEWEVAGELDVEPAWVPEGKFRSDERFIRYYHCNPPEVPFVLKDLNGDNVPEVLVAFNYGHRTGYTIARKEGQGIKLLDLYSTSGEPEWTGTYLVVTTWDSGRKAWGSEQTYYRWEEGVPVAVAAWQDDTRDPEKLRSVAVRHEADGKDQRFDLLQNEDGSWSVRRLDSKGDGETKAEEEFARIVVKVDPAHELDSDALRAEEAIIFELLTGIPATAMRNPYWGGESFDFGKSASWIQVTVEGGDEAKTLLKRVTKR